MTDGMLRDNIARLALLLAGRYQEVRDGLRDPRSSAAFLAFVERQHLAWYLTGLLDSAGLRDVFDGAELDRVGRAVRERQAKQGLLLDELGRLWPKLAGAGIDATLLKGPHLAERFFGGARKRGFLDLDLLVRPKQLDAVEGELVRLGYTRLSTVLVSRRLTTLFTHGFDFEKGGLRLDLHWSLGAHASYRIDYDRLWNDRAQVHLGGVDMAVLSDEDALSFHLVSLFEDLERGAARLRSFVDVHAMVRSLDAHADWPAFFAQRRAERTEGPCRAVLAMFVVLFDGQACAPRLVQTMELVAEGVRRDSVEAAVTLIAGPEGAVHNKRWAMRQYESSVAMSAGWWLISLPFRLAVYHPGRWSRFRRWLTSRVSP